jgi:hypothetical protein
MTLSDYWAPGPPSPGFDITCTHVSLGMGSTLRYTGTFLCHACSFCLLFDIAMLLFFPTSHDAIVSIACY